MLRRLLLGSALTDMRVYPYMTVCLLKFKSPENKNVVNVSRQKMELQTTLDLLRNCATDEHFTFADASA